MGPQSNQVVSTQTTEQVKNEKSKTGGFTTKDIAKFKIHEDAYNQNKEDAKFDAKEYKDAAGLLPALVEQLNENAHLESLSDVSFVTSAGADKMLQAVGQEDKLSDNSIYRMKKTQTVIEGIKQLQYIPYRVAKTSDIVNAVGNEKDIQRILNHGINIDDLAIEYFEGLPQKNNPLIDE
jgi:predicted NUDIX family phosphoesterase